ncbi:13622_t:CDS:2, partial [Acaulospora morrowiae]
TPKKTDSTDVQATMRRVREAQLRIANRLNTDGPTADNSPTSMNDVEMMDANNSPAADATVPRAVELDLEQGAEAGLEDVDQGLEKGTIPFKRS